MRLRRVVIPVLALGVLAACGQPGKSSAQGVQGGFAIPERRLPESAGAMRMSFAPVVRTGIRTRRRRMLSRAPWSLPGTSLRFAAQARRGKAHTRTGLRKPCTASRTPITRDRLASRKGAPSTAGPRAEACARV